jgi:nitroreductase
MNPTLNTIKNRRSIRKYIDKKISEKTIKELVEAAKLAPSSHNAQPWNFTIINNKKGVKELSDNIKAWFSNKIKLGKLIAWAVPPVKKQIDAVSNRILTDKDLIFYEAPLVVLIHATKGKLTLRDCSCAAQNMMLAARSLEIGSCWIGYSDMALNSSNKIKESLNIPKENVVMASLVFGYPLKFPDNALPRKDNSVEFVK